MTETQLAILLRQYHARLVDAIAETFSELPEAALTTTTRKFFSPFDRDSKDGWVEREIVEAPALEPVEALAKSIDEDIKRLESAASNAQQNSASR